ncbi:hypothetical protein ENUP19_0102G0018 [Entamoeba nuttalli]|uniref:RNA recognition motif (RRM, RBD, or RNP domain) containing protein n=2 Tax=Entamoeba nuttalli TaxID=412467 RepID=K2GS23_ENTNP|nr:RNA recognition motif (RRM, RBD, or RNP domain) containing protein [Entamoeba nuttalli P19]EKE37778.1 RNA recognition motif (RRM, RBD, or RNP domain) containing protein [Entamoeba nuttalli P19]|eukprot:XP_008859879.1 RNA recognition motif (RRM, RBD, or RNP domain) containing protein [Entamoeba nuttalli P19]
MNENKSKEAWSVFIRGISPMIEKDDLKDFLIEFGKITSLLLYERKSCPTQKYAIVLFKSKEQAEKCINEIDGKSLLGHRLEADFVFMNH